MGKKSLESERGVKEVFKLNIGKSITFKNQQYTITKVGKPTCSAGEPKTDVYVRLENEVSIYELKISYKQRNFDFIENHFSLTRAEELFGKNCKEVIINYTKCLSNSIEERCLIFKSKFKSTDKGSFTLGWKSEITKSGSGKLSVKMNLTKQQVIDIYAGTNLPENKRNAKVNGEVIANSGVANYILESDCDFTSIEDILNKLEPITEYVERNPDVFLTCKTLNFRSLYNNGKGKYDGDRPLCVYVDWGIKDNKLFPKIVYNNPLIGGKQVFEKLKESLNTLCIKNTEDICKDNVISTNFVY